jgi:hypothetical protein
MGENVPTMTPQEHGTTSWASSSRIVFPALQRTFGAWQRFVMTDSSSAVADRLPTDDRCGHLPRQRDQSSLADGW